MICSRQVKYMHVLSLCLSKYGIPCLLMELKVVLQLIEGQGRVRCVICLILRLRIGGAKLRFCDMTMMTPFLLRLILVHHPAPAFVAVRLRNLYLHAYYGPQIRTTLSLARNAAQTLQTGSQVLKRARAQYNVSSLEFTPTCLQVILQVKQYTLSTPIFHIDNS